jgi:hypothetical protein
MKKTQVVVYAMVGLVVLACIVSILVLMHTGLGGFIPHGVP